MYPSDFRDSATRHFRDAETLKVAQLVDSAAYHYGIAAECAIKVVIAPTGVDSQARKHISRTPEKDLRSIAMLRLRGRRSAPLLKLLQMPGFFANWDVEMRYAVSGSVAPAQCDTWRNHCRRTLGAAGISV